MTKKSASTTKLSTIRTNNRNPRQITEDQFKKLLASIAELPKMMALRPIIVDADGVILGGNMRYRALIEMGWKAVPSEWIRKADDLTPEEKRRFIIADNVGFGEWDMDILSANYDLPELEAFGLSLDGVEAKPDFAPGTEEDQGKLDELAPKMVECPHCKKVFDSRGHEQG